MKDFPKTLPFHNSGKTTVHVGGKAIAPGATRPVESREHPDYLKLRKAHGRASTAEKPKHPALALLALSVADLAEQIANVDAVSVADLDMLEAAEKADKNRKGALAAIQEQRMERAKVPESDKVNLGELLDGEEPAVLLKIETLKKAVDEGAGLTQEAIDQLLHSEEHGANREAVTDAIMELVPKEATENKEGKGLLAGLFGKKD